MIRRFSATLAVLSKAGSTVDSHYFFRNRRKPLVDRPVIFVCSLLALFASGGAFVEAGGELSAPADCSVIRLQHQKILCLQADGSALRIMLSQNRLSVRREPDYAPLNFGEQVGKATLRAGGDIIAAWLSEATDRYRHGVFGEGFEAARINAMLASGRVVHRRVENNAVFEDRQVRITDIDADGHNELLVVEARPDQGASLALYMLVDDTLQRVAASSPIGTSNRWLNPVGSGDFDGDGREEIAIVETPHLGALLVVYRWRQNQLVEIVRKSGFSNHRFGDPEQGLSTVIDIDGDGTDEMVIPDARIQELQIIRLVDEQVKVVDRIPLDAVLSGGVLAADLNRDGQPELIYGTADGLLHAVIF